MNETVLLGYYEDLIVQIESNFKNLKKSFEEFNKNTNDKKLFLELCRNYSFLLQDVKYIEKFKHSISGLEFPISSKLLRDLKEIKIFLRNIKEFLINNNKIRGLTS
jgi:hypothetical protein